MNMLCVCPHTAKERIVTEHSVSPSLIAATASLLAINSYVCPGSHKGTSPCIDRCVPFHTAVGLPVPQLLRQQAVCCSAAGSTTGSAELQVLGHCLSVSMKIIRECQHKQNHREVACSVEAELMGPQLVYD